MSLKKYALIYNRIDQLIKNHSTGTPQELANKLGVSRRQALNYLRDFKEINQAEIKFSVYYNSYLYLD